MERRTKRRIKNALIILFKLFVVVAYIVALVKFFAIDEIIEKMEYGLSVIILTILFFSRE